ncbi:Melanoma-associated antigen B3 [Tupaia chinensis]|uniref:Melanoma-associated antigen B3 n=1 Tax=Tupaia chinensis TaxID=246437 RepID=L9JD91_TUPCH|nr:Melanoma-associated antigen B3 [Tupaia chinensis]
MPQGQKSKLHTRERCRQARGETQGSGDAQATSAPAEEPSTSSSSLCGSVTQSLPAAGSGSPHEEPQKTPSVTTAAVGTSSTNATKASNSQYEKKKSTSETQQSTENSCRGLLNRKALLLEQFLLYKYKMKQRIKKEDMLKVINPKYEDQFAEIFKKASQHIEETFAVEVKEIDSTSHLYDLVSKLKLPNNGRVRAGRGLPKTGLLMNILGMIFMRGNCASEEDIWKFLNMMNVYAGRKHFIFGEPRKLITQDLVRLKYLVYQQVPNSDPACYEFLWGPRAHEETSKMKVLEFLAKIHGTVPTYFPSQYEEALQDEEERAQARNAVNPGTTAQSVVFRVRAKCPAYSSTSY